MKPLHFLFIFFLFSSCDMSSPSTLKTISGIAMTMNYRIMLGSIHPSEVNKAHKIVNETFDEVDQIFNNWNPNSEISKLNQLKAHVKVPISHQLESFLKLTGNMVKLTQGRFDPTIGALQQLWRHHMIKGTSPDPKDIKSIAASVGWDKIHIQNGMFYKDHEKTQVDFGGIAKGYCVDLIVERLKEAEFKNTYVEWGGEIRTQGKHPSGRPWSIFLSWMGNPDPKHALAKIEMQDQAIASSGDYWQIWNIEDGRKLTHIINPITLSPLEVTEKSIAIVNVLAPTCALADALATTGMLFDSTEAATIWFEKITDENPDIIFWISTHKDNRPFSP